MANDHSGREAHQVFGGGAEVVPRARHLVADRLRTWDLGELIEALELITAELVTNAIEHGRAPIELIMVRLPDRVRLEVHDEGGGHPAIRPVSRSGPDIGGWGLRFVDDAADAWGTHTASRHTMVWAERAVPALDPA